MAEIVNLRMARKAKARSEAERAADASRAKFGRTKAERALSERENDRVVRVLDAHRRETD